MQINQELQNAIKQLQQQDSTLTSLNLYNKAIGEAGAKALSEMLRVNQTLTSLNLYFNVIGNAGAKALAEVLTVNQTLTKLNLGLNRIDAAGAKTLGDALKTNQTLTLLSLNNNTIGDTGAQALSDALTVNQTLTSLNLNSNGIGAAGATALVDALRVNQALTSLNLRDNAIGDAGAKALGDALRVNQALTSLDLDGNGIGDAGAKALGDALRVNRTLTSLHLQRNRLGDAGVTALVEALTMNRALIKLDVDDRGIDAALQRTLEDALKRNRELRDKLHAAIDTHALASVKTLLAEGGSMLAQDNEGNTPLHRAMQKGHEPLVRYLASLMHQHGVPFTLRNQNGQTALDLAQNATQRTWLEEATSEDLPALKEAPQTLHTLSLKDLPSLIKEEQAPLPTVAPPVMPLSTVKGTASPPAPSHFEGALLPSLPISPPAMKTSMTSTLPASLTVLFSELTLQQELGRGAMGIVYRGTWRYTEVAIKQLHLAQPTKAALDEFEREITLMAHLRSAHIIQLYAMCMEPGRYSLVMEYAPKGALYHVLHDPHEALPWPIREHIALGIAKGLYYLHQHQPPIVHRDLKSLNVLLDNQYQAKLTDFRLATLKTETTTTTCSPSSPSVVGTYPWMAPEIFGLKPKYSPASDMYAYAMVLWELVARRSPYAAARGDYQLIRAEVTAGTREDIPPETPPTLAHLITWGWKGKPEERPTAEQAIQSLTQTAVVTVPRMLTTLT